MDREQAAKALHEAQRGKIATSLKVRLETREDLALAYTPGVADVSMAIARETALVNRYTNRGNTVAIVTDGSAVLGLGNIGPQAALPVMEGKAALFKRFADVDAVPICLDTQDADEIVAAVAAIAPSFAGINLEDIAAPRCFAIEAALQEKLSIPVFHDDQHGTATVVLAGLFNALKVKGLAVQDARIVISGAGAAGLAIFDLLWEAGFRAITVLDSKGVLSSDRADLNEYKKDVARKTGAESGTLLSAIANADVFVGVSAGGLLTAEHVRSMAPDPIVFAMANPEPEIMPSDALLAGALIVATGRSDFPNQINNALAFPGIFRGALDSGTIRIQNSHLINVARAIADLVPDPTPNCIVPDIFDERLSGAIARVF